jgi:hypothetical protein
MNFLLTSTSSPTAELRCSEGGLENEALRRGTRGVGGARKLPVSRGGDISDDTLNGGSIDGKGLYRAHNIVADGGAREVGGRRAGPVEGELDDIILALPILLL